MVRSPGSTRRFMVMSLSALALGGCDTNTDDDPLAKLPRGFTTYNLGLATGYVDYAEERRPKLIELIQTFNTDVICMQEVWTEDDAKAVVAGVAATYPYSHYEIISDDTVGPPACTQADTVDLLACVEDKCDGVPSSEITNCVLNNCGTEFGALPDGCVNCLAANIGKEIPEIVSICQAGSPKFTYGGANGLLVISRSPISDPQHLALESSLVQRSVLGVTVNLPLLGKVAIACTHIASDLSKDIPYTGPFASYEAENKAQAEAVRDFLATYGASASLRVVMGDINSGPGSGTTVTPEIPLAGYSVLKDAGFAVFPSAMGDSGMFCTFCADNALINDETPSVQLDHIALSVMPAGFSPAITRIATEPVTITAKDGATVTTNASDHYGVSLRLNR